MENRAVIFDLDGTLLNTLADLANSMNSVLHHLGFPEHDVDTYKYFVGDGMEMLVRRALPEEHRFEDSAFVNAFSRMQDEYARRSKETTRPYDGVPALLDALTARKIRMAILSNKPDEYTKQVVAELLPFWHFDPVIGARSSVPKKPDPAGAVEISHLMGIPTGSFLYLGDTNIDMKTANAAGMFAIGALWGFRKADELIAGGAKALISEPMELLHFI